MMIDFALEAERDEKLSPSESIYKACLLRFRPIMMTTHGRAARRPAARARQRHRLRAAPPARASPSSAGCSSRSSSRSTRRRSSTCTWSGSAAGRRRQAPRRVRRAPEQAGRPRPARRAVSLSAPFIRRPVATIAARGWRCSSSGAAAFTQPARWRRCRGSTSPPSRSAPACRAPARRRWPRRWPRRWSGASAASPGVTRDHLHEHARHHVDHPAVRSRPRRRLGRARRAGGDQRGRRRAARQPAAPPQLPEGQPRRRAHPDPLADLGHRCRCRRSSTRRTPSWPRSIAQVEGVGQVFVGGGQQPAVRVQVDPEAARRRSASRLDDVRTVARRQPRSNQPKGSAGRTRAGATTLATNDQLFGADDVPPVVVARHNGRRGGAAGRRGARRSTTSRTTAVAGWTNGRRVGAAHRPAPAGREHHRDHRARQGAASRSCAASISPAIDIEVALDRTQTIRASVHDVEMTLRPQRRCWWCWWSSSSCARPRATADPERRRAARRWSAPSAVM